uniref:FAST kinase domain-containing protein 4 n=1 Tax=Serinus canaria TaxID=9135 RepID=A0A8C9KWV2_SERCA
PPAVTAGPSSSPQFCPSSPLCTPTFPFFPQYCLDNAQELSITQLCGILVSFARLNFQPSSSEEFFSMVKSLGLPSLDMHLLTDVVWSLCVLQQPQHPHLRQVLSPEFQARLRGDSSLRAQSSWLKLLHINATARLEAPGYEGPFLPPELLGGDGDRDRDKDKEKATPLQRWLREALPGALGGHDLVRYNVSTVYGWDIGECHPCHPRGWHPPWAPLAPPPLLPSPVTPVPPALSPCYLPVSPCSPLTFPCPPPCHLSL